MFLRQALAKAAEASLEVVHGDGGLLLNGVVLHFGDERMCMVSNVCEGEDVVQVGLVVSMNSKAEAEMVAQAGMQGQSKVGEGQS